MNPPFLEGAGWQALPAVVFALLLGVVFFLIIRQNRKDLLELEGILASENSES